MSAPGRSPPSLAFVSLFHHHLLLTHPFPFSSLSSSAAQQQCGQPRLSCLFHLPLHPPLLSFSYYLWGSTHCAPDSTNANKTFLFRGKRRFSLPRIMWQLCGGQKLGWWKVKLSVIFLSLSFPRPVLFSSSSPISALLIKATNCRKITWMEWSIVHLKLSLQIKGSLRFTEADKLSIFSLHVVIEAMRGNCLRASRFSSESVCVVRCRRSWLNPVNTISYFCIFHGGPWRSLVQSQVERVDVSVHDWPTGELHYCFPVFFSLFFLFFSWQDHNWLLDIPVICQCCSSPSQEDE